MLLCLEVCCATTPALAEVQEKRIALLIQNDLYSGDEPAKIVDEDASTLAASLKKDGFEVELEKNVTRDGLRSALDAFAARVTAKSVALVYFKGIGIQASGTTFMIPVDGRIWSEDDVRRDGTSLDVVMSGLDKHGATVKIAVIDAARPNPFERRFRTSSAGLAPPNLPEGSLVIFADALNRAADPGQGPVSPFMTELVRQVEVGGGVEEAFTRTREAVSKQSKGHELPWVSSTLAVPVALVPGPVASAPSPSPQQPPSTTANQGKPPATAPTPPKPPVAQAPNATTPSAPSGKPAAGTTAKPSTPTVPAAPAPSHTAEAQQSAAPPGPVATGPTASPQPSPPTPANQAKPPATVPTPPQPPLTQAPTTTSPSAPSGTPTAGTTAKPSTSAAPAAPAPSHAAQAQPEAPPAPAAKPAPPTPHVETAPPKPAATEPLPGTTFSDCPQCPEMTILAAATFKMGSGTTPFDRPVHDVTIPKPFAIARAVVTREEWAACVDDKGCTFRPDGKDGAAKNPVVGVNWFDAKQYVDWLRKKTGKSYRLPTEAEWEYAARGGTATVFAWGDAVGVGHANCADCGDKTSPPGLRPVRSYPKNGFGLFDMAGNVAERVQDCWTLTYRDASKDGATPPDAGCKLRVVRGGSFETSSAYIKPTARFRAEAEARSQSIGFRVARDVK